MYLKTKNKKNNDYLLLHAKRNEWQLRRLLLRSRARRRESEAQFQLKTVFLGLDRTSMEQWRIFPEEQSRLSPQLVANLWFEIHKQPRQWKVVHQDWKFVWNKNYIGCFFSKKENQKNKIKPIFWSSNNNANKCWFKSIVFLLQSNIQRTLKN